MLKKYSIHLGVIFTATVLSLIHIYTPVTSAISTHHSSSHSQHTPNSSCQSICQANVNNLKVKILKDSDRDKKPYDYTLIHKSSRVSLLEEGLLTSSRLWLQTSWMPPDIALLSGYYSTSL